MMERDADGIAHLVGISGGKDSVCMALALAEREPRPYTYYCTPTGNELPEMVAHLDRVEKLMGRPIIRLEVAGGLRGAIYDQGMIPNCHARWCTRILKLRPAGAFFAQAAPCISYVGLRADEDEREGTRPGGDSASIKLDVRQDFPFQRWDWGIDEVWGFLNARGIEIPDRTDCAWCPYQKLGEWYILWRDHLEIYLEGEAIEVEFGFTFRSPQRDTWPASLKELRALFEAGKKPEISLRMMEKRHGMCRACSM